MKALKVFRGNPTGRQSMVVATTSMTAACRLFRLSPGFVGESQNALVIAEAMKTPGVPIPEPKTPTRADLEAMTVRKAADTRAALLDLKADLSSRAGGESLETYMTTNNSLSVSSSALRACLALLEVS